MVIAGYPHRAVSSTSNIMLISQISRLLHEPTIICRTWTAAGTSCIALPPDRGPVFGPECCRSSVVEHSLGKGEVVGSIPTGSTILFNGLADLGWNRTSGI